jgi:hypothetical protein
VTIPQLTHLAPIHSKATNIMIKYTIIEPEVILVLEPNAPLEADDFGEMAQHIDPYIAKHGKLPGLMIHVKKFPGWASLDAFAEHMRFVKNHLKNVLRVAMVSDSVILPDIAGIAAHLVDAEVKHFPNSAYGEALHWLKEGAKSDSAGGVNVASGRRRKSFISRCRYFNSIDYQFFFDCNYRWIIGFIISKDAEEEFGGK